MAFVAKKSSSKGEKGDGEGSKKKKGKCFNCKKVGHYLKDCLVPGGGAEGQGPKQKEKTRKKKLLLKQKKSNDGVWMATIDFEEEEVWESCEMWTAEEIIADGDIWEECLLLLM